LGEEHVEGQPELSENRGDFVDRDRADEREGREETIEKIVQELARLRE